MPNEAEYYAPTLDEITGQWVADAFRDCHRRPEETENLPIGALRDAAARAIAAHDKALREQIERGIEAKADDPDPTLEPQYFTAIDIAASIARGEGSE